MNIKGFLGINDAIPADRVKFPDRENPYADLTAGVNVDVDDGYVVSSRPTAASIASGAFHSLWSDGGAVGYCMKDGILSEVDSKGGAISLLPGLPDEPLTYAKLGSAVYFVGEWGVGSITPNLVRLLPDVTEQFKTKTPGGQCCAAFAGRLLVGRGKVLYISDAFKPGVVDSRRGFRAFPDEIDLIAVVADGVYVAAGHRTYFLAGLDPLKWVQTTALDFGGIQGSVAYTDASFVSDKVTGRTPVWLSTEEACMGLPSGQILGLTASRYRLPSGSRGRAYIRSDSHSRRYVAVTQ